MRLQQKEKNSPPPLHLCAHSILLSLLAPCFLPAPNQPSHVHRTTGLSSASSFYIHSSALSAPRSLGPGQDYVLTPPEHQPPIVPAGEPTGPWTGSPSPFVKVTRACWSSKVDRRRQRQLPGSEGSSAPIATTGRRRPHSHGSSSSGGSVVHDAGAGYCILDGHVDSTAAAAGAGAKTAEAPEQEGH